MIKMIAEYSLPSCTSIASRSLIYISISVYVYTNSCVCIAAISFIRLNEILVKCQLFRFCDSIILSVFHHHFIFSTSLPEYSIRGSNAFLPFPAVFHLPFALRFHGPSLSVLSRLNPALAFAILMFLHMPNRTQMERDRDSNREREWQKNGWEFQLHAAHSMPAGMIWCNEILFFYIMRIKYHVTALNPGWIAWQMNNSSNHCAMLATLCAMPWP